MGSTVDSSKVKSPDGDVLIKHIVTKFIRMVNVRPGLKSVGIDY